MMNEKNAREYSQRIFGFTFTSPASELAAMPAARDASAFAGAELLLCFVDVGRRVFAKQSRTASSLAGLVKVIYLSLTVTGSFASILFCISTSFL